MTDIEDADFIEDESEYSYQELMDSAILNGEILITIPASEEEKIRVGLKNYKARLVLKAKEENLPIDRSFLAFESIPSEDYPECIDMKIIVKKPSTIKVKRLIIPEQLPD